MHKSILDNINLQNDITKLLEDKLKEEATSPYISNKIIISIKNDVKKLVKKIDVENNILSLESDIIKEYNRISEYDYENNYVNNENNMIKNTELIYKTLPSQAGSNFRKLHTTALNLMRDKKLTWKQAVKLTIGNYKGCYIVYKDGKQFPFEKYLQMLYKTECVSITRQHAFNLGDELNTKLYQYSSWSKAKNNRKDCLILAGNIITFEKSVKSTHDENGSTHKVYYAPSYGWEDPDGPQGINCGHTFYPYIEGTKIKSKKTNFINEIVGGIDG